MTDNLEAPQEGVEDVVHSEEVEQASEASEGTESTEGLPNEATADAKAEEEKERTSRSERRRQAKERAERDLRESEAARQRAEDQLRALKEAGQKMPVPKQDNFDTFEEFQAALSAHHAMQMLDGRDVQRLQAEAQAHYQREQQVRQRQAAEDAENWQTQMADARTRYADFDKVALRTDVDGMITAPLAQMIQGSDVAAEVAYHIGKNPEIGVRMSSMSPVEMARAFGRLEATLSAPKAKTTSNAPDPISPVKGAGSVTRDPSKMSIDEYRAQREKGWHP